MEPDRGTRAQEGGSLGVVLAGAPWKVVLPLAAALALGLGALRLLDLIARPLALLVLAVTLAEALSPLVHWLEARIGHRALAVTVVYLVLLAVLVLLGWLVAPALVDQGRELADRAPELVGQARRRLTGTTAISSQDISGFTSALRDRIGDLVITLPQLVLQGLTDAGLVVFLSVYWLITVRSIRRFTLSLFPADRRERAGEVLSHMGRSMGGYVRGSALNALVMGILAYVGLRLIHVSYPLALAVLTMLGEVVPIVGPIAAGVVVAGVALLHSVTRALVALALYTGLQQVEGHLLTPNIMRNQTDVPQTLVLFAIVVGAGVGGVLGIFVAIPAAAAVRVLVVDVLAPAERRAVEHERDEAPEG